MPAHTPLQNSPPLQHTVPHHRRCTAHLLCSLPLPSHLQACQPSAPPSRQLPLQLRWRTPLRPRLPSRQRACQPSAPPSGQLPLQLGGRTPLRPRLPSRQRACQPSAPPSGQLPLQPGGRTPLWLPTPPAGSCCACWASQPLRSGARGRRHSRPFLATALLHQPTHQLLQLKFPELRRRQLTTASLLSRQERQRPICQPARQQPQCPRPTDRSALALPCPSAGIP